ncbi:hypothetical protein IAU60_001947 [Kwoniella sp. DSM 27419]
MKRHFTPTPLGYTVLLVLVLVGLFLLSPADMGLPMSWTSKPRVETDQSDTLPALPEIYAATIPSLTLPAALLAPRIRPLATRLSQFLHRPILNHSDAAALNYAGCPRELADKLVNPDQYNGEQDFWRNDVDTHTIVRRRSDIVDWLDQRARAGQAVLGEESKTGSGRGIVLTGGNQDTTLRTITVLKHLRRLQVDLPIEVFHYSDELHDQDQRREIESLGATLREAEGLEKIGGVWKNWQVCLGYPSIRDPTDRADP